MIIFYQRKDIFNVTRVTQGIMKPILELICNKRGPGDPCYFQPEAGATVSCAAGRQCRWEIRKIFELLQTGAFLSCFNQVRFA
jgi:hypothetical protein